MVDKLYPPKSADSLCCLYCNFNKSLLKSHHGEKGVSYQSLQGTGLMLEFVITLLILSGVLVIVLSITAFQRRASPLAWWFGASVFCAGVWNFSFAAELISPTLAGKIFWANIQFLGIPFLPVTWLAMAMCVTAQPRQNRRVIPALALIPIITNLVIWTNPYHHLFRQSPAINTVNAPFPMLINHYGSYFYAVHVPYGYLLCAVTLFLLLRSWRQVPAVYRRQRLTLVSTLLLPLLIDTIYVLGITPIPAFNFTSIVFSLSGLLLSANVLYLRLLDFLPLAYEAAINEMNVGVVVLDVLGRVSHLNPAAGQIMAVDNDQVVGIEARQCLPQLEPLQNSAHGHAEITIRRGQKEFTFQLQRTAIMKGRKIVGNVITLNDITERVQLIVELKIHRDLLAGLSFLDSLTNIPNRRRFDEYLSIAWGFAMRESQPIALILIDIDHFKKFNDNYGHQAGDTCLVKVASALVSSLKRQTDLVARYGGEEFACILPNTDMAGAMEIAESFRESIMNLNIPHAYSTAGNCVTISQGVASLKSTIDIPASAILKIADQALYKAKESGRNKVCHGE